jgi:hypothetical protein
MRLKKFNEEIGFANHPYGGVKLKQFVLTTTSESSDHYIYFIEHPNEPTSEELKKFLLENGSDVYDGECYEEVDMCVEITDFKRL